jgi:hypothetical protein
MTSIREFSTGWGSHDMGWSERTMDDLVGVSKGGHLMVPNFRPFDFLEAPNKPVTFMSASSNRVGVEAVRGTQPTFRRNADFDEIFFQCAGETTYETELGVFAAKPAELMLIPTGVSHRATGSATSLRMSFRLCDPVEVLVGEDRQIGHTEYDVTWRGGPEWPVPPGAPSRGRVLESVHAWEDEPGDETLIEREYDRLVGSMTKGRPIQKIRLFDIFTEITGRKGQGPTSIKNDHFFIECFNSTGAQFAFHRGYSADEAQFQFQGSADNISEFGAGKLMPGDLAVVRRGIAHRVIGSPTYRRMTFYTDGRWKMHIDPSKPSRQTTWELKEKVIEAAPWRQELETRPA